MLNDKELKMVSGSAYLPQDWFQRQCGESFEEFLRRTSRPILGL